MKELVFPKDQEMFQGIDENGMLIPFDGTDTMASSYEINIDFYRNQHDTMKGTGSSEEEAERDIWKQMQIILSAQWTALEQVVENASQRPIGRFPKTCYELYVYEDGKNHKLQTFSMIHFWEMEKALNQYKEGLAPGGPFGERLQRR